MRKRRAVSLSSKLLHRKSASRLFPIRSTIFFLTRSSASLALVLRVKACLRHRPKAQPSTLHDRARPSSLNNKKQDPPNTISAILGFPSISYELAVRPRSRRICPRILIAVTRIPFPISIRLTANAGVVAVTPRSFSVLLRLFLDCQRLFRSRQLTNRSGPSWRLFWDVLFLWLIAAVSISFRGMT